jgi:hypothetical protein
VVLHRRRSNRRGLAQGGQLDQFGLNGDAALLSLFVTGDAKADEVGELIGCIVIAVE